MGKRSEYERKANDFYVTQLSSLKPLVHHLPRGVTYIDPCYGTGAIEAALKQLCDATCVGRGEKYPEEYGQPNVLKADAISCDYRVVDFDFFITNPPWDRSKASGYMLHEIINNLAGQRPTWLLFDADWMHTHQASEYLKYCVKVVSVGRASWMDNGISGKDNCAWYLFDKNFKGKTAFYGRVK